MKKWERENITICADCEYRKDLGLKNNMWYNYVCVAPNNTQYVDLVTGLCGLNHLRPDHPFCRDINDGDCKNYKPKNIYDPMGDIYEEMGKGIADT